MCVIFLVQSLNICFWTDSKFCEISSLPAGPTACGLAMAHSWAWTGAGFAYHPRLFIFIGLLTDVDVVQGTRQTCAFKWRDCKPRAPQWGLGPWGVVVWRQEQCACAAKFRMQKDWLICTYRNPQQAEWARREWPDPCGVEKQEQPFKWWKVERGLTALF